MKKNKQVTNPAKYWVDALEAYEVQFWAQRLNISFQELQKAIKQTGASPKDVEKLLQR